MNAFMAVSMIVPLRSSRSPRSAHRSSTRDNCTPLRSAGWRSSKRVGTAATRGDQCVEVAPVVIGHVPDERLFDLAVRGFMTFRATFADRRVLRWRRSHLAPTPSRSTAAFPTQGRRRARRGPHRAVVRSATAPTPASIHGRSIPQRALSDQGMGGSVHRHSTRRSRSAVVVEAAGSRGGDQGELGGDRNQALADGGTEHHSRTERHAQQADKHGLANTEAGREGNGDETDPPRGREPGHRGEVEREARRMHDDRERAGGESECRDRPRVRRGGSRLGQGSRRRRAASRHAPRKRSATTIQPRCTSAIDAKPAIRAMRSRVGSSGAGMAASPATVAAAATCITASTTNAVDAGASSAPASRARLTSPAACQIPPGTYFPSCER